MDSCWVFCRELNGKIIKLFRRFHSWLGEWKQLSIAVVGTRFFNFCSIIDTKEVIKVCEEYRFPLATKSKEVLMIIRDTDWDSWHTITVYLPTNKIRIYDWNGNSEIFFTKGIKLKSISHLKRLILASNDFF